MTNSKYGFKLPIILMYYTESDMYHLRIVLVLFIEVVSPADLYIVIKNTAEIKYIMEILVFWL